MLGTVIRSPTDDAPPRRLQQPIALVLLATVAGISKILFHLPTEFDQVRYKDRIQFVECLKGYFPWDIDPPKGVFPEEAVEILYDVFRNPLVHALGFTKAGMPTVRIGQLFRGTDDPENSIEALERLEEKPYTEPCLSVTQEESVLLVDPFYWGVRKLVERWSGDDTQVLHAEGRLRKPASQSRA
ncbi:MAG: hypothetical protein OXF89_12020 [Rhodospirillaceae bacterium]|nr:hypothetical protein [Rhodospirillaceae bacterium]